MVAINSSGNPLVNAVVSYFRELGFKADNVDCEGKEDVRVWINGRLIIIEVTGNEDTMQKEIKVHAISKHIPLRKMQYPNLIVTGAFIVNHDKEKHYLSRANRGIFTENYIKDIASLHHYTIHTTVEMLQYFIEIKIGSMTTADLIGKLITFT